MRQIKMPRGSGRTITAVKLCAAKRYTLVVHDSAQAEMCVEMAKEMGLEIKPPITFWQLKDNRRLHKDIGEVFIDDLDWILRDMFPHATVVGFTDTEEVE